jgi:gliding motility-associated-like protein
MASPDDTTIYTVIATSDFGCESEAYSIFVHVLPTPFADAGPDATLCRGDSVQLAGSHAFPVGNVGTGPVFYAWTPVSSISGIFSPDPVVFPVQTVVYTLSVSHGACTTTDEVKIDVFDAVSVSIVADTNRICQGDSVQLLVIGGQGGETYTWSPATGLSDPAIATPMASPDTSITYSVLVEESSCKGRQDIRIEVNPRPDASFYSSLTQGCEDLAVSFLQNSPDAIAYVWDFGDGSPISNEANPEHLYENPGSYLVRFTATGAGGCNQTSNETVISVYPKGRADFSSLPPAGSSEVLPEAQVSFLDRSAFATGYIWNFGDGTTSTEIDPVHTYREPGEYFVSLTITDDGGCTDEIRYGPYVIFAPELLIPNVFTPNADGFNDIFRIEYSGRERFRMEVFDRWGVPVFETEGDPNQGWDGSVAAGGQAKEGVYYYTVRIGEKSYTGNVTLMR